MKPIPWSPTVKLIVMTILTGGIAAGGFLAKANPQWVWLPMILQMLIYVDGLLTTPNAAAKRIAELAQKVGSAAGIVLIAGSLVFGQTACARGAQAVGPVTSCVSTVIVDALKGMTLEQILVDAGPGCVKDIEQVAIILLGSQDPKVQATPAFAAAKIKMGVK